MTPRKAQAIGLTIGTAVSISTYFCIKQYEIRYIEEQNKQHQTFWDERYPLFNGCISTKELPSSISPLDLSALVNICLEANDITMATKYFVLQRMYLSHDYRLISATEMNTQTTDLGILSLYKMAYNPQLADQILREIESLNSSFCEWAVDVGYPDYDINYFANHDFNTNKDHRYDNYNKSDSVATWNEILEESDCGIK